jgi:Holliday junction resolvase RusA-like endonuclease
LPQHAPPLHATGADAGASTGDFGGPDSDYWIDPTDTSEIQLDPSGSAVEMVLFTVQGQPRPLKTARFRMFRRKTFTFNPSATYQASFLKAAKDALSFRAVPVFPNQPIFARVVFWVRRPNIHFIASTRGPGRLKPRFLDQMDYLPHRSLDADNLAKFVLDALNGLLYADDSQVVSLQSTKAHDNIGSCNGRVEVQVWRVLPKHLHLIVQSPYHLFR